MKKCILAFSFCVAAAASHAAPVSGFNNVIDLGGGVYKFIFDTAPSDRIGNSDGIIFDNGSGLTVTATSAQGSVIQDAPANGGLGVLANNGGTDNMETSLGETILLTFNMAIDVIDVSLNGLLNSNGHTDEADGQFAINGIFGFATNYDDVGTNDGVPDTVPSLCGAVPQLCDITTLLFTAGVTADFKGYIESVTIRIDPVPVPASIGLLGLGLAGLGAMARRKRKAA